MSTHTLHIEPTTDPDDGSEYGILDQEGTELAVVYGGKPLAQLFATAEELLEVARQYVSECAECNGAGLVTIHIPGNEGVPEWDADDQPCPDCTPTRALIARAGGVV